MYLHTDALSEEQQHQRVATAFRSCSRGKHSPLFNYSFVHHGPSHLDIHQRLLISVVGVEKSHAVARYVKRRDIENCPQVSVLSQNVSYYPMCHNAQCVNTQMKNSSAFKTKFVTGMNRCRDLCTRNIVSCAPGTFRPRMD